MGKILFGRNFKRPRRLLNFVQVSLHSINKSFEISFFFVILQVKTVRLINFSDLVMLMECKL